MVQTAGPSVVESAIVEGVRDYHNSGVNANIVDCVYKRVIECIGTFSAHVRHNNRCLKVAQVDEPMFVLLARDATAPTYVAKWLRNNGHNLSAAKREAALQCLLDMYRWQADNPTKVKRPD